MQNIEKLLYIQLFNCSRVNLLPGRNFNWVISKELPFLESLCLEQFYNLTQSMLIKDSNLKPELEDFMKQFVSVHQLLVHPLKIIILLELNFRVFFSVNKQTILSSSQNGSKSIQSYLCTCLIAKFMPSVSEAQLFIIESKL